MRKAPYSAEKAAVTICSTMLTKVGKGTLGNKIKIVRVKISSIAPAKTSVGVDKNLTRRRSPKF